MVKRSARRKQRLGKKRPSKTKKYSMKRFYKRSKRSKRSMKGGWGGGGGKSKTGGFYQTGGWGGGGLSCKKYGCSSRVRGFAVNEVLKRFT